jgi:hypothetical protein
LAVVNAPNSTNYYERLLRVKALWSIVWQSGEARGYTKVKTV